MKKILLVAAAGAAMSTQAVAAPGDTAAADGSATATVVSPITLTHDAGASLSFGTITAGGGGTVVVNRNGRGSVTGEVSLVDASTTAADAFTVGGDANRAFVVTAADGDVTNTDGDTMSFTTNVARNGTLDGTGAATFTVGGELTVPDSAPVGTYTGTYEATVTYN